MLKKMPWVRRKHHASPLGICFEPLEPRLLLSGSWGAGIEAPAPDGLPGGENDFAQKAAAIYESADTSGGGVQHQGQHPPGAAAMVDILAQLPTLDEFGSGPVDPIPDDASTADKTALPTLDARTTFLDNATGNGSSHTLQQESVTLAERRELVFVDTGISSYQQLVDELLASRSDGREIEVIALDTGRDGIEQVSGALEGRSGLAAVHFITHASDGQINLGNTGLNSATLEQNRAMVSRWGNALTESGDILFYGCNIAADSAGQSLLNNIAELTGTDVAASEDLTGNARLGGDWLLEFQNGEIETNVALSPEAQQHWSGVLATYTVTNTNNSGAGSLRQAITDANTHAGADAINFNITGTGSHTITLSSALPAISGQVTIDATTDDSFAANGNRPAIILNGNNLSADGLVLSGTADGSIIRGLVIRNFSGDGIEIQAGSQNNTIAGNYIGRLNTDGTAGAAGTQNDGHGIYILGSNTIIGGTTPGAGNVVSGNSDTGIEIEGSTSTGNRIEGNIIGLNAAGTAAIGNLDGVIIEDAPNNIIGGATSAQRNIISGNTGGSRGSGVVIFGDDATGNLVQSNYIGTDITGALDLGNADSGVRISDNGDGGVSKGAASGNTIRDNVLSGNNYSGVSIANSGVNRNLILGNYIGVDASGVGALGNSVFGVVIWNGADDNQIGDITPGAGNVIAYNNRGVLVDANPTDSVNNSIRGNSIYGHTGLGIDLGNDGVSLNDSGDMDLGPNNLRNYPVITSATVIGSDLRVVGTLNTRPLLNFEIDFYWSPAGDPSGHGEGQTYIGSTNGTSNFLGNASFNVTFAGVAVPVGAVITATAIDSSGNTSEFSLNNTAVNGNTAPVLNPGASPALAPVNEDAGAPVGAAGTLVSSLVDFASPAGQVDNVSDVDSGAQLGIAVTAASTTNGSWWYSTNGGTSWSALGAVAGNNARLLAANANTRIYFQPNANYNGTLASAITFRAWDQTSGSNGLQVNTTANGGTTAFSTATDTASLVINPVNDAPTGTVTISGTPTQGQILTASNTLADLDGLGTISYQWRAAGTNISGATGASYVLTEAEVGKLITVVASYTDGHGTAESVTSSATAAVANVNDAPTGTVTISGTPTQGQILTASNTLADLDGLGTISYQWRAAGTNISGATGASYVLTEAEVGKLITVVASYTDGHGTAESVTSSATAAVANVNDAPTGTVTISGTPTQGQILTASNTLADLDGLGTISYQWRAAGTNISGATGASYVLTEAEVGKLITVVASYTDGHGTAESVTSSATAAVANVNDAPTGTVTISGTPTQGQILTASNTLADLDGLGTISYQWRAAGTNISGATGASYVLTEAEVGKLITVVASYTDGHGTAESVTSSATAAVANVNDAPTGTVTISGTPTQGQILTASNTLADLDGLGTISYQWRAAGTNISGATGASYVLTEAEVGKLITVVASYTDGHGTAESVTSSATAAVANVNDAPTGTVTISGTPTQGQTLTASNTLADLDGLGTISYQWRAAGTNISGATGASYVLTEAEVGKLITVVASYTDGHGTAESVTSSATAAVANVNDAPTGTVTISGTPTQGQILTASNTLADLDGLGTISYQWRAAGTNISGATGASYVLTEAEVGKLITVVASYTDGHGTAESVTSSATAAVANVNDAPTGSVTISGTPTQGQTLTASNTLADLDGLGTISYQWRAAGTNISGATGASYVLTEAEVGKLITVVASYTDGHGTAESVTSSATAAVANVNDAPTGLPTITGAASKGQTLTAMTSGISDADGLGAFSYQWLRGGVAIGGATSSAYILDNPDVGTQISVQVSYTDAHGTAESLTSAQTAAVTNLNDAPTGSVTISGTPTQGQTLNASNTLADGDGLGTISYQWQSAGTNIGGATGASYLLSEAEVGKAITVVASYTDGHGTAEAVSSTATALVANLNDAPTGSVTISGTPTQGQTLAASNILADADGLGTISYQWQAAGTDIAGATGASYLLSEAEVGKAITVVASYTDGHGTAEAVSSAASALVANLNDAPTGSVTISGTPTQGQTLAASNILADADGLGTISYQWQAAGTNIAGATGATYVLTEAEVGKLITVVASYTDGHNTAEAVTSVATALVANLNDAPTGSVTISGTPTQGQTLAASNTLADLDGLGSISYQWQAGGVDIAGATNSSYLLTEAEVGKAHHRRRLLHRRSQHC